jgi:acyl-CoA thioesterase I
MLRTVVVLSMVALLPACGVAEDDGAIPPGAGEPPARTGSAAARDERGVVLFVGTSLTAGYGLGEAYAYPALLQRRIDDAGLPFRTVNAGISGETSAGGASRIDWLLQNPVDVLVLELGANDALRGLPVAAMRDNLDGILRRTRELHPDAAIVLLGMEAPPNLGPRYTTDFRETFRELAAAWDAALLPFLLEGVAAEPSLNLSDGIHPNEQGQRRLADNVWEVLRPVLQARVASR